MEGFSFREVRGQKEGRRAVMMAGGSEHVTVRIKGLHLISLAFEGFHQAVLLLHTVLYRCGIV